MKKNEDCIERDQGPLASQTDEEMTDIEPSSTLKKQSKPAAKKAGGKKQQQAEHPSAEDHQPSVQEGAEEETEEQGKERKKKPKKEKRDKSEADTEDTQGDRDNCIMQEDGHKKVKKGKSESGTADKQGDRDNCIMQEDGDDCNDRNVPPVPSTEEESELAQTTAADNVTSKTPKKASSCATGGGGGGAQANATTNNKSLFRRIRNTVCSVIIPLGKRKRLGKGALPKRTPFILTEDDSLRRIVYKMFKECPKMCRAGDKEAFLVKLIELMDEVEEEGLF
jgi:hypothetical protein